MWKKNVWRRNNLWLLRTFPKDICYIIMWDAYRLKAQRRLIHQEDQLKDRGFRAFYQAEIYFSSVHTQCRVSF
jgi:hypothetical protein